MFDVHQTTAAAYAVTVDGDRFVYSAVNRACLDMAGLTPDFIADLDPKACFSEPVAEDILRHYRACRDTGQAISYICETGHRRWRTTLFPMADAAGRVVSIVGVCVDASNEARTDQRIVTLDERLSSIMGAFDGGFWVYEMATGVFETSASLARYLAGPGRVSLNLAEYAGHVHADDLRAEDIFRTASDRSKVEYRIVCHDGRVRWVQSRRRTIKNRSGAVVRVIGLVMDITDQKRALSVLESQASTDALTSLKNRRAFDRAAAQAFADARKTGSGLAIALIDLDGFKPINDRYGHRAGDEILRKVARRLARVVGETQMLARLGGDEFAVLLTETSPARAQTWARRIAGSFDKPFRLDDKTIPVGISIGLAVATASDASVEALLERADCDLYAEKRTARLLTA